MRFPAWCPSVWCARWWRLCALDLWATTGWREKLSIRMISTFRTSVWLTDGRGHAFSMESIVCGQIHKNIKAYEWGFSRLFTKCITRRIVWCWTIVVVIPFGCTQTQHAWKSPQCCAGRRLSSAHWLGLPRIFISTGRHTKKWSTIYDITSNNVQYLFQALQFRWLAAYLPVACTGLPAALVVVSLVVRNCPSVC